MLKPNMNYANLKDSYLFYNIDKKISAYSEMYSFKHIYKLGIGDVSLPLCSAVISALHGAVDEMAEKETFHGYVDECGAPFLRKAIAEHYLKRGIELEREEVFVSSGASDELGDILDLFDNASSALVIEPAYPAYVDANIIAGRKIIRLPSSQNEGFAPYPDESKTADIIYICSPNNPTGAVFTRDKLKSWVDFANKNGSVILFDAAYEAFIEDEDIPHSIFEIDGAKTCAIEICSLSKTAGFTGVRCGYTIVPKDVTAATLTGERIPLNPLWNRRQCTKFNGTSYISQRAAEATYTPDGKQQIRATIDYYMQNAKKMLATLRGLGFECYGGENAPYIWAKTPETRGSWQFFEELLYGAHVVCTPGVGFGPSGEGYVRFTAFGSHEQTDEALDRIATWCKQR